MREIARINRYEIGEVDDSFWSWQSISTIHKLVHRPFRVTAQMLRGRQVEIHRRFGVTFILGLGTQNGTYLTESTAENADETRMSWSPRGPADSSAANRTEDDDPQRRQLPCARLGSASLHCSCPIIPFPIAPATPHFVSYERKACRHAYLGSWWTSRISKAKFSPYLHMFYLQMNLRLLILPG